MPHTDVLDELYAHAAGRLGAYGYVLTGSQSAGEELAQAAIVKVFVRSRGLDNVRAAEAYVRAAMRSIYIDGLRRETLWRRVRVAQAVPDQQPDAAAEISEADSVQRALATLAPQVRAAVVLHYLDDLSVADVAQQMRVAVGTVKRYLADGRAQLAPLLGDEDGDASERVPVVERSRP